MADEEDFSFQQAIILMQDLGFQGFEPENVTIYQPIKKPKGLDLSTQQKQYNKEQSQQRVSVEHAIRGIKILRIVQEKIRSHLHAWRDLVMYLACAIHNFKIKLKRKKQVSYLPYSI